MPDHATSVPGTRSIAIGDFRVTTICDGALVRDDPYTIFGTDQAPETVAALLAENFLPADRFRHTFTPTLVEATGKTVLFDTGFGNAGPPGTGLLRERLIALGHPPNSIDAVVLTHLHGDHYLGLVDDGVQAFPNAECVIGAVEYDFWTSGDHDGTRFADNANNVERLVAPFAEKTRFLGDNDEIVSGITAMTAFGHSPGHLCFHLESGGARLMLTADTANHFVLSIQRPDWEVVFDADKEQAAATRRRIFSLLAAERIPFIGHHMPPPCIGFVETMGDGFRYVPASYQFDL